MEDRKKVFVFDYWAYYSPHLEVMAVIARREADKGHDVRYFTCDGNIPSCEVDPYGTKIACANCKRRSTWATETAGVRRDFVPVAAVGSVDDGQLRALQQYSYRGVNIGMGCASSYISRTRDQDLILNCVTRPVLKRQIEAAKQVCDAMHRLIDEQKPDLVYLFNGRGFVNRAILGVCEARGIDYVTVEVGANDERVEEYHNSLPHSISARTRMMRELWAGADAQERMEVANAFYARKRAGEVTNDKSYVSRQITGLLPAFEGDKTIIAIFNSSDDEIKSIGDEWSLSARINQYDVVEELLDKCVDDKVFFIVRMHPNLAAVNAPWVKNWERIRNKKNCLFLDATSKVSSYEVLDAADKVLVFGSTIGAEAAAVGKPVLLYGNAYYERLDLCYTAADIDELRALCSRELEPKDREPALMYAYFLLKSGVPLPGYEGDKRRQAYTLYGNVVPIRQEGGLRGRGGLRYARNWLGNRLAEWRIRLSLTLLR